MLRDRQIRGTGCAWTDLTGRTNMAREPAEAGVETGSKLSAHVVEFTAQQLLHVQGRRVVFNDRRSRRTRLPLLAPFGVNVL